MRKPILLLSCSLYTESEIDCVRKELLEYLGKDYYVIVTNGSTEASLINYSLKKVSWIDKIKSIFFRKTSKVVKLSNAI